MKTLRYVLAVIAETYRDFRNEGAGRIEALAWTWCGVRNIALRMQALYVGRPVNEQKKRE